MPFIQLITQFREFFLKRDDLILFLFENVWSSFNLAFKLLRAFLLHLHFEIKLIKFDFVLFNLESYSKQF